MRRMGKEAFICTELRLDPSSTGLPSKPHRAPWNLQGHWRTQRHSHVISLDHVKTKRNHLDATVRGVLALNTVREDDVAVVVAAFELALGLAC